ncbi:MAG: carbon-phosphorus lyase complex subunit PhnI [Beijerinckiaceae bacterium]
MYVAVKGGETAIENAHRLLARDRRGDTGVAELSVGQVREQLSLAVARVMCEGSLYDPDLAALAIKQARGDLIEAIFLARAYRTTLPRFGEASALDTGAMRVRRRVSAVFKDIPGGQILGPTFDYTHRLLDPALAETATHAPEAPRDEGAGAFDAPHVLRLLDREGLVEAPPAADDAGPDEDITRTPVDFPAGREMRLQALSRGDEGFLLALAYSTQRGYGRTHPFAGEIRVGEVVLLFQPPEFGFEVPLGEITITECEMINQFRGTADEPPRFTTGYGCVFGQSERKAMSMALVDRSLRATELGEFNGAPAQDEEFVISHCDNVQATGFVEHLKLPHYVDFQAELGLVRQLREEWFAARANAGVAAGNERSEAAE